MSSKKYGPRLRVLILVALALGIGDSLRFSRASAEAPRQLEHFDAMPKPVRLNDGTLVAYFIEHSGPGLPETPETQHVTARRSVDDGETWSNPQHLFTLPSESGYFGYFVQMVDRDGESHLFILGDAHTGPVRLRSDDGPGPRAEPLARQSLDVWHVRSHGNHQRWSTPRLIWKGRAGDLQSAMQMSSGRILLPLSYFVDRNWGRRGTGFDAFTYKGQFDVTVLYSDDGGETWQTSEDVLNVPTPGLSAYGAVEPVVVELSDGRVWMMMRTQLGRFYESFSSDGARWSSAQPSTIRSSDSPSALLRTEDGRIVMLWNNCLRYPYAQGARNVLQAAISDDDGQTWRGMREVLRDPHRNAPPPPTGDHGVSYPYATLTAGDRSVVYALWVETGDGRSLHKFDLDWLEETQQDEDFSDGLEKWSTFGTRGVQIVSHAEAENGHALKLSPPDDPQWPTAAVWNFPAGNQGRLSLRVMLDEPTADSSPAGSYQLILTDHFSVPFDLQDAMHGVFVVPITTKSGGDSGLDSEGEGWPAGRWVDVVIEWDCEQRLCRVTVDGQLMAEIPSMRSAPNVSYLRLRPTSLDRRPADLLVDHLNVDVAQP